MVSVVEQARQNPVNATPLGWDVTEVRYPAVNTCTTVTVCGQKGLVGLHLGLMMGGDLPDPTIDNSYLDMYLNMTGEVHRGRQLGLGGEPRHGLPGLSAPPAAAGCNRD
jgi:hypothetical protein